MRRLAALLALFALPAAAQLQETITVERILLDIRVTEFGGEPITDLKAEDFEVEIGGKRAEVISATWVDDLTPVEHDEDGEPLTFRLPRLFVFFIQTDFARNAARLQGQMHFLLYAEELLAGLTDDDRVAVFSFDSHLKFRLDFTRDKAQVLAAMRESLNIDMPGPPPVVESPSIARGLDRKEMKRAADSESALLLVGNALRPIPGRKTMFLMGWGLGEYSRAGVRMKPKYRIARAALEAARVTIFALDTTNADYHDLEIGLGAAAKDTGGFYAKTHVFPKHAIERLHRTLAGHYELELRRPDKLRPGTHDVDVRVKRRGATVLAPGTWMDR